MERLKTKTGMLLSLLVLTLMVPGAFSPPCLAAGVEETIAGAVVKTDKGLVIEADDGNYLIKGKDLSKMVGKLVEITGIITESEKGDSIEVKSFEEIQE